MDTRAEHPQTPSTAVEKIGEPSDPKMPISPTTTLPPPISSPSSSPGPVPGAATPWVRVPYKPIQISSNRKTPSIERFLDNFQECFAPVGYYTTNNGSSTQCSGTAIGFMSAFQSTQNFLCRSTIQILLAVPNKIRKWYLDIINTVPFGLAAWARLTPHTTEIKSSIETTAAAASPDVIKTVPMPIFPIRVFYGIPPPFSLEAQKRKMRWRYRWHLGLAPELIQEPDVQRIQETVQQYIEFIAPETETISVTLLAQGAFNQAYNIAAENKATGFHKEYVFRVALPIYPHYKVESDVATTEFVRHTTTIPVPIIYAFDSSPDNKLGFEWMLMEKVQGVSLYNTWDSMGYNTKREIIKSIANWMGQLARLNFNKIGSLYCRQRAGQMEFYLGPTLNSRLYEGDRLLYDIPRGPFESLYALYDAVLDATERHINDPKHSARHKLEAAMDDEESSLSDDESLDSSQQDVRKSEKEILAQADKVDRRNEQRYGVTEDDLEWLPDEIRILRVLLPKLCPLPSTSEPMITMLTHPDLSAPNIFVSESGAPVALIDWERTRTEPSALINAIPQFLVDDSPSDPDCFYIPPGSAVSTGRKTHKLYLYGDEDLARIRGRNERMYTQVMCRIQESHLRALYREELKRLQSPLCKAFERDAESLEHQLISHVYRPEYIPPMPPYSATDWAVKHLGELILAELDENPASDDREELAEGREI